MHCLTVPPRDAPVDKSLPRALPMLPYILFQNSRMIPPLPICFFIMHIFHPFGDVLAPLRPRPSLVLKLSGTQGCPCSQPR